jgi:hypothetical protein
MVLRRVALIRTDVLEEPSALITRVTRIGELGTTLAATINRRTSAAHQRLPLNSCHCTKEFPVRTSLASATTELVTCSLRGLWVTVSAVGTATGYGPDD